MKIILSFFSLVMLSLLALADNPKPKLDGSWQMIKAVILGNDMPDEIVKAVKMVFKGNECETDVMGRIQHCTITFDDATNPKRLKLDAKDGPDAGKSLYGIYELNKDELKLCFALEGKDYPTEFKSPLGSKLYFAEFKRSK